MNFGCAELRNKWRRFGHYYFSLKPAIVVLPCEIVFIIVCIADIQFGSNPSKGGNTDGRVNKRQILSWPWNR